jgi:hypothetical protein
LGNTFFDLKSFDITADSFGAQSFDIHVVADLEAKLNLDVDHATVDLEADTVGLREIANDIKGIYLGMLRGELTKDLEAEYRRLSGVFNAREDTALRDLGTVLH